MASLNQATLIGYAGADPRIINTQSGRKMASFSLATTEKGYTSERTGKAVPDRTEWHNIVLWARHAELAERFIRKGSLLLIQGKLRTRQYTARDGSTRYVTEIEAEALQLLDRKADAQQQGAQQIQPQQPAAQQPAQPVQTAMQMQPRQTAQPNAMQPQTPQAAPQMQQPVQPAPQATLWGNNPLTPKNADPDMPF